MLALVLSVAAGLIGEPAPAAAPSPAGGAQAAPARSTAGGATGWVQPERGQLQKIYGLRHLVRIAEPGFLEAYPSQWVQPFISNDSAIAYAGTSSGAVRAVWTASGRTVWERRDLGAIGRGMAQVQDTLLVGSDSSMVGLQGDTGKELWRADLGGIVGGEIAVTGTIAVVPIRPNGYVALDASSGKIIWRHKRPTPDGITIRGQAAATIDPRGGRVYVGFADGMVAGLSLATGDAQWTVALAKEREPFADVDARPLLLEGGRALLAASYSGGLARLEADSGRIIERVEDLVHLTGLTQVPGARWAVASYGDGQVLGLDAASGKVVWRYRLRKGVPTIPVALGKGYVAVGSSADPLAILEASTGRPVQLVSPGSGIHAAPFSRGVDLAVFTDKGTLLLLRHGAGEGLSH